MNPMGTNVNYHEALEQISAKSDPIMKQLQELNRKEDPNDSVIWGIVTAPLKDMKRLPNVFNDISSFNISAIPLIGSAVASFLIPITTWSARFDVLAVILVFTILYCALIPSYFKRMITFGDSIFHLKTYKSRRAQEYNLISYAVESNFSYKGLYDFISGVLTHQDNTSRTIEIVTNQYNKEKDEIRTEHKDRLKEVYHQVKGLNETIVELQRESEVFDTSLIYLDELLADINVILFRIANGVFGISDLKFLSGFTIYRENGKELVKIYDEGTTGSSPNSIDTTDPKFEFWEMAVVSKDKIKKPKTAQPRDKYNIISYRMPLGKPALDVWIFNFHINREINKKAWHLLRDNEIIAKEEIYRLFHALCLLLYNQLGGALSVDRSLNKTNQKNFG